MTAAGAGPSRVKDGDVAAVVSDDQPLLRLIVPATEAERRRVEASELTNKLTGAAVKE